MPQQAPITQQLLQWLGTFLLGIITWLSTSVYKDVKELRETIPAMQQQIKTLEEKETRMENKVFAVNWLSPFAKHEDFITVNSLLKK